MVLQIGKDLQMLFSKLLVSKESTHISLGNDKLLGEMIHIREYTKDEIEKILKRHNFRQIKVTHFWFGTPFLKYGTIKLFDWSKNIVNIFSLKQ